MYKNLQERINEIKKDFSIGALKECERKVKELKEDLTLASYLVSIHVGNIVNEAQPKYMNKEFEPITKQELEYEINLLEKDIECGYLPVEYIFAEQQKDLIMNNSKRKNLKKEKLEQILNIIDELEKRKL